MVAAGSKIGTGASSAWTATKGAAVAAKSWAGAKVTGAAAFVVSHPEIGQAVQGFSDGFQEGYANVSTLDQPYEPYIYGKKLGRVVGTAASLADPLFR